MIPDLKTQYGGPEFRHLFPGESADVEFKSGLSNKPLQEAAVAFSNTSGGVIFVGISDDGSIVGRANDQGAAEAIHEAFLSAFDLGRYSLGSVDIDGRTVITILVHPRTEGFAQTSDGRILTRAGSRNQSLIGSDLQTFISQRSLRRFESTMTEISVSEVDPAMLEALASARGWPLNEEIEHRLAERGFAREGRLTVAGALTLTRPSASMSLEKCVVEVRRYPREGVDYDRREVFDGPLQDQVRLASQFVSSELGSELVVSGLYRYDLPKIPEVVVREAIANAVAHRSYEIDRTAVVVELREDRVIVRSPGGLPEPVTVETIRVAQAARNPILIQTLRDFSLAEDAGRGIDVMQDSMRDALLDAPEFEDSGSMVTVTLPLRGPITIRERGWLQELERSGKLLANDRLLVIHAARGESLSNSSAREILGIQDRSEARKMLQRLRDAGVLVQNGDRGSSRYSLAEAVAPPAAFRMSQRDLMQLIVQEATGREIVNEDVRAITGLDSRAASRLLTGLVESGTLRRIGTRRGARYVADV